MATVTAPDELLLGFTRALRSAGLPVTADRARMFLRAVATVGAGDRRATYWAGRATLCTSPEHFPAYDKVFTGWFLDPAEGGSTGTIQALPPVVQAPSSSGTSLAGRWRPVRRP